MTKRGTILYRAGDLTEQVIEEFRKAGELSTPCRSMAPLTFEDPIVALADSWASIDGKLDKFRAGKDLPIEAQPSGHYAGYLADAEAMIENLRLRGFVVVRSTGDGIEVIEVTK